MLNTPELRKHFKQERQDLGITPWQNYDPETERLNQMGIMSPKSLYSALALMAPVVFLCLFFIFQGCGLVHAEPLTDKTAVLAVIGEAEGESQTCRIAIAETIRKRGSLKGIYGAHSKRVLAHKYSNKSFLLARAAWWDSQHTNYSKGASGWGNKSDLVKFKKCGWFRNCQVVAQIDGTYFWKEMT